MVMVVGHQLAQMAARVQALPSPFDARREHETPHYTTSPSIPYRVILARHVRRKPLRDACAASIRT